MNNRCSSLARHVSMITLPMMFVTGFARGSCSGTTHSVVDRVDANSLFPAALKNSGYEVVRIKSDSLLRQKWAIIANCAHPEWPAFALPSNRKNSIDPLRETFPHSSNGGEAVFIIRAGDIVRLWRRENLLRIEIPGVSEENGHLGDTVRVRLLDRNSDDRSAPEHIAGIVRGPSNVEMQR
jgi:Chaperone for flagella basal body P-ring formation